MNALLCTTIAQCAGAKNVKLADFLTIRRESEEKIRDKSPAGIVEQLKLITMAMGGKMEKKKNG